MKIPNVKIVDKSDNSESNNIKVDYNNIARYYNTDVLFEDKAKHKFIQRTERLIRGSVEYRNYISLLKNELDLTRCTFLPEVDIEELGNGLIEFHHYPLTLYDIVSIKVEKRIAENKFAFDEFDVADDVMIDHYRNIIGLVPLSETVHELAHKGLKFINLSYVQGNYKKFIKENNVYITDLLNTKLSEVEKLSEQENHGLELSDENLLSIKKLYIENTNEEKNKEIEKIEVTTN